MQRLKAIVALLVVGLWLPASSHVFLERFGFIHQIHAHDDHRAPGRDSDSEGPHEHGGDNHTVADGKCLASSGKVQLAKPVAISAPLWLGADTCSGITVPSALTPHSGPSPPGVAPPDLSRRWQFSFRAALPARAPSVFS